MERNKQRGSGQRIVRGRGKKEIMTVKMKKRRKGKRSEARIKHNLNGAHRVLPEGPSKNASYITHTHTHTCRFDK